MKRVKVRQADGGDLKQFNEFMFANRDLNHFDPDIMTYKSTRVLAAEDANGPVLFLPYQAVAIMTDSLAPRPDATKKEKALALRECIYYLIDLARKSGIGEIYFVATDDETRDFALSQGYEEIEGKLLRLKPHKIPAHDSRPQ